MRIRVEGDRNRTREILPREQAAQRTPEQASVRDWWELGLLGLVAVFGTLAPLLDAPIWVRTALGIPLVLFVPGYALVSALFPSGEAIDGIERIALGFGLSLALIPLIALGIQYSPWRLTLGPILGGLLGSTIVFSAIAVWRRRRTAPEERFVAVIPRPAVPPPRTWDRTTKFAVGLLVVSLLLLGGSGAVLVVERLQGDPMTEFALYNADGRPEFYPRDLVPGTSATVKVQVVNDEGHDQRYRMLVTADAQEIGSVSDIAVPRGGSWEQPVAIHVPALGQQIPVLFELFKQEQPAGSAPYRTLRLFVNGVPPSPTP